MKPISKVLWETEFPDKPFIEDMTMEEFHAAESVKNKQNNIKWLKEYIDMLDKMSQQAFSRAARDWAKQEKDDCMLLLVTLMEG